MVSDINECEGGTHNCSSNAVCNNTKRSYNCTCKPGYEGDGNNCTAHLHCSICLISDINECEGITHNCSSNAVCNNTKGSYNCTCKPGYEGDGDNCTDIDECATGAHDCSLDASCSNTNGSFVCFSEFGCKVDGVTKLIKFKGYNHSCAANSCEDVLINTPGSKSGAYHLKTKELETALTYCHMEEISGCGGGGWTLVMKIDGAKTTFSYNADLWSNKMVHNQNSGEYGLDNLEAKMPSFWSNPFTKLCLGMRVVGEQINWILVNHSAVSLHDLLSNNNYTQTQVGRATWKSLVNKSSLQNNCNMEGFNVVSHTGKDNSAITRIGIISNNENDCSSCNSRIGFGSAGSRGQQKGSNSCGNEAGNFADNGEKHFKANCYIFVQ
ncbi:unnamed protein product [Porites lobata]|uniref:EGF-like domain-containing protein n=1 Tax=Porites lobata TaxID=104759 RepID=A0ABN8PFW2_9CNID|nr:unnamed protein product [Porites lobata]